MERETIGEILELIWKHYSREHYPPRFRKEDGVYELPRYKGSISVDTVETMQEKGLVSIHEESSSKINSNEGFNYRIRVTPKGMEFLEGRR